MRLIDADALERMGYVLTRTYQLDQETMVYETKKLSDVPSVEPDFDSAYQEGFTIAEAKYRAIIDDMKAAQPELKKGHWVGIGDEPDDEWECDACGFVIDGSGCIDPEEYRDVYRFCPNCGAKMEAEE